jgi:hypothetical protein
MDPLTAGVLIVLGALAIVAFWPWICNFLSVVAIPFLEQHLGHRVGDSLRNLLAFLDKIAAPANRALKEAWATFKYRVLSADTVFQKNGSTTAMATTTLHVRTDGDQVVRQTSEQTVPWEDLPEAIRDKLLKKPGAKASLDVQQAVEQRMAERLNEDGLDLGMAL